MTDREKLVEVMAQELGAIRCRRMTGLQSLIYVQPETAQSIAHGIMAESREDAEKIFDAAERAGFRWVGPDDGR